MSRARRNGELCSCLLPVTKVPTFFTFFFKKQLKESMDEGETEDDDDYISDSPSTPGN
jgi:hypothetical protein